MLYPTIKTVSFQDGDLVLLACILAGEISGNKNIQWFFNGQMLSNTAKYTIALSSDILCAYGTCQQSQLQIRQADANDAGKYTCSYENLSQQIIIERAISKSMFCEPDSIALV